MEPKEPLNPFTKPAKRPYSAAFSHMVTLRQIIPVVIFLVFIILQPDSSYSHAHALDISSFFGLTIYQVDVMPPKGKLSRKKATHEGHKTTVKHIAYDDHEQLDDLDENKHVSKLRQQRESLRAKDEEILSNVKEEIKQIL